MDPLRFMSMNRRKNLPAEPNGRHPSQGVLLTVIAVNAVHVKAPEAKTTIEVPAQAEVAGKRLQAAACNQKGVSRGIR